MGSIWNIHNTGQILGRYPNYSILLSDFFDDQGQSSIILHYNKTKSFGVFKNQHQLFKIVLNTNIIENGASGQEQTWKVRPFFS